jgi:hypothetical protein
VAPVTVTPVLYMADGTRYALAPVTLEPAGVFQVDINQALADAPANVIGHLSDFGSASIEYTWPWKGAVMATVENLDVPRSLVFHFLLQSPPSKTAAANKPEKSAQPKSTKITKEGLWWKHDEDVVGFIALTNISQSAINAHLEVSASDHRSSLEQEVNILPNSTQRIDLASFMSQPKKYSGQGGVTLTYKGTPADLVIVGGLENEVIGYSAKMTFATKPTAPTTDQFVASAVGIMVGAADPMMMFPAGTVFKPYAVLRNTSAKAVLVAPSAHYMNGTTPITVRLRPFTLQANEAAQLDVPAELASAGVHSVGGMLTLGLSSTSAATDLLLASGSVDQTGSYVFEVECKGSGPSEGKILGNWNVADGNDTMVSVWNSSDSDQDLTAILFYSGGQYKYPVHLAKNASTMFNVSEIIMMQMPDADGNVIPVGTPHGSAVLSNATGQSDPLNVGVSVGTFNAQTATCGTKCPTCLGYTDFWLSNAPFSVGVGSNYLVNALAQLQNGSQVSKNTSASWGSSNGSVGNSSGNGNFQGVSGGNFLANANISLISVEQDCPYNGAPCGTDPYSGSGTGAVPTLSCPGSPIRGSSVTCSVNAPSGSTYSNWKFTASGETDVNGAGTTSSWAGTIVKSGTVTVSVTVPGASSSTPLSQAISVLPRSNWGFAPSSANKHALVNSFLCVSKAGNQTISVNNPPSSQSGSDDIGKYCDIEDFDYQFSTVSSGPNQGYAYIISATNKASFDWIIAPDADNPGSTFYSEQCGNYDLSTNTGFLSGPQLQSFTIRHESSSADGHYGQYVAAQNDPNNNLGTTVEAISHVFTTNDDFNTFVATNTQTQTSTISSKTKTPEPCNVNSDDSLGVCTYKGPINFAPNYAACP